MTQGYLITVLGILENIHKMLYITTDRKKNCLVLKSVEDISVYCLRQILDEFSYDHIPY